jgi:Fe-S oxidoreductase
MVDEISLISSYEKTIFISLLAIAVLIFLRTYLIRFRLIGLGKKNDGFSVMNVMRRIQYVLMYVPGQWCNIKNIKKQDLAGLAHLFIFWGITLFTVNYFLFYFLADGLGFFPNIRDHKLAVTFLWITELSGIFLVAALVSGVVRRGILKPKRLGPDFEYSTFFIITASASLLLICYYILEGCRSSLIAGHIAGPVSSAVAALISANGMSMIAQTDLFHFSWWVHNIVLIGFIVYVPFSKHQHALFFPLSLLNKSSSDGRIKLLNFDEEATRKRHFGVANVQDLPRNQLVELYSCVQCGRCQDVCPANLTGKPLSPKKLIQDLKESLETKGNFTPDFFSLSKLINTEVDDRLVENYIASDEIWACTTCLACVKSCPALIEQLDKIIEIRKNLTLSESTFPSEFKQIFKNLEIYGDTMGKGNLFREDWTSGLKVKKIYEEHEPVDLLFWTGCMGSLYDEKTRAALKSSAKILDNAGLNWGILGKKELCCGDWARRVGNEYLYELFVKQNIEIFKKYNIKRLVTNCPHCYNTMKNEYFQFGSDIEVLHIVELIEQMLKAGKLKVNTRLDSNYTYHDPCYLGRYNSLYEGPRKILGMAMPPFVKEMQRTRKESFCCGAGGGNFWRAGLTGQRMEEVRIDEALDTGAKGIITACPYCKIMFNSAVKEKGREHSFSVLEVSEVFEEVVG